MSLIRLYLIIRILGLQIVKQSELLMLRSIRRWFRGTKVRTSKCIILSFKDGNFWLKERTLPIPSICIPHLRICEIAKSDY